jgi:hypothetical protein
MKISTANDKISRICFTRAILFLANARGLKSEVLSECAARQFHFPLLAGGTIPFMRKYSTICP